MVYNRGWNGYTLEKPWGGMGIFGNVIKTIFYEMLLHGIVDIYPFRVIFKSLLHLFSNVDLHRPSVFGLLDLRS